MRLRLPLLGTLAAALLAAACGRGGGGGTGTGGGAGTGGSAGTGSGAGTGGAIVAPCNAPARPLCGPYGIALPQGSLSDATFWTLVKQGLSVTSLRPETQSIAALAASPAACARCDAAAAQGLGLVVAVANGGPPASLGGYAATVGALADRYKTALAVIVIEDEPTVAASWSGTPAQYLATLAAGCQAAHAHGARCANGGIDSTTMLLTTADAYLHMGFAAEARRILTAASSNPAIPAVASDQDVQALLASRAAEIGAAREILTGLPAAGADFANFHWYEADEDTFDETIALVRQLSGCNSEMSDGLGTRDASVAQATFLLNDAVELGLVYVVLASPAPGAAGSVADASGAPTAIGQALAADATAVGCGG